LGAGFMETLVYRKPVRVETGLSPPESADAGAWCAYYDEVYRAARGDAGRIPWADGRANPGLVTWLNNEAPTEVRPGARVTVVGCGLGHDVSELAARGFDVTGFDVSPSAVAWERELHPAYADRFETADLFALPRELLRRSDLVVEVYTLQSLAPDLRPNAVTGLVSLMRPHGCLVAVCRGRGEREPLDRTQGPPFPLTGPELASLLEPHGLRPTHPIESYLDDEEPPVRRLRGAFRRR